MDIQRFCERISLGWEREAGNKGSEIYLTVPDGDFLFAELELTFTVRINRIRTFSATVRVTVGIITVSHSPPVDDP